jgi:hypothetical protein
MREKSLIAIAITLYFSITLITASPFQNNSIFDDPTGLFSTTPSIQSVYAADDGGSSDGGSSDGGSSDGGSSDGGSSDGGSSDGGSSDDGDGGSHEEEEGGNADDGGGNDFSEEGSSGGSSTDEASSFFGESPDGGSEAGEETDAGSSGGSSTDEASSFFGESPDGGSEAGEGITPPTEEQPASTLGELPAEPPAGQPTSTPPQQPTEPPSTNAKTAQGLFDFPDLPDFPKFPDFPTKPPIDPKVPIDPVKPPVEPPVKPPVEPPVKPPVEPPVKPPVEPPVKPPVEPPVKPPVDKDKDTKVITIVKVINKNKVVVRDNNDGTTKQIIVAGDRNTCITQSESVPLSGKINPKGIRLLADFDPCKISDGSVTLNMPNTDNIKLAVLSVDKNSNNKQGVLITPIKIQNINSNQALFTVELDDRMTGENPISGKSNTLTNINGLALYNDGGNAINFKSGNMAALTATLSR